MPNYQKGRIYKIINDDNDDIYIGSTCSPLSVRMSNHRGDFNQYKLRKSNYITSFKILEFPSAKIILIENFPCNTKEELTAREAFHIRNLICVNKNIPLRTDAEYRIDNLEAVKEGQKKCYEANKEHYLEKARQRREVEDKEEVSNYKKDWYIKNKEKLSEQKKIDYEANKEQIKARVKANYEANKEAINQRRRDSRKNEKL